MIDPVSLSEATITANLETLPLIVTLVFYLISAVVVFIFSYYTVGVILALLFPKEIIVEIAEKEYILKSSRRPLLYGKVISEVNKSGKISEKTALKITKKCTSRPVENKLKKTKKIDDMDISDIWKVRYPLLK